MNKITKYILIFAAVLYSTACSDSFLTNDYKNGLDDDAVEKLLEESPDAVVNSYVNAIYSYMVEGFSYNTDAHDIFTFASILHTADMTAQDMVQSASHWFNYDYDWDNRMNNYRRTRSHWGTLYTMIAKANTIINLFEEEPGEDNVGARAGLGQALAIRGLSYYYLIQLYQQSATEDASILSLPGVPMRFANSEDVADKDALVGRNTVKRIHEQIESDLSRAVDLLKGYERPVKFYVDQAVAYGFLARFYLLTGEWQKADDAAASAYKTAQESKDKIGIMPASKLHDGFMDLGNEEWMWGFAHTTETQTAYASWFSMMSNIAPGYAGLGYAPRLIDRALYDQIPNSDERKKLFNDEVGNPNKDGEFDKAYDLPYANLKFGDKGDWTMDYVYMRAAEMILIQAEAKAHLNNGAGAATVLKTLMAQRDPKWNKTSVTVDDVFLQRRIELWGEGFNFFDFKRLNKVVDRTYAGSNHRTKIYAHHGETIIDKDKYGDNERVAKDWTYQIPITEIQENELITSNND